MFKLSVEHIALFILAVFLLYHLTRSCGCANCVDGFNVGVPNTSINISDGLILQNASCNNPDTNSTKIPICCLNMWNTHLPDYIKNKRGDSPEECINGIEKYINASKSLTEKNAQYMWNFNCTNDHLINYCSFKDKDLYKWTYYNNKGKIDPNSSNTRNTCDLLEFLNNTPLDNPDGRYDDEGYERAIDEWHRQAVGEPSDWPQIPQRYNTYLH